jgi:uncharacterized membrane protein YkvA (DUF1232 family)
MPPWAWILLTLAALYAALVAALCLTGRRREARVAAQLIGDCVGLVRRLMRDPRVPRRWRWGLAAVLVYLVVPFDLVPDFVPVAGQLDDALLVVLALRGVLRSAGPVVVAEHWFGSQSALAILSRIAAPRPRRRAARWRRRPRG